MFRDEGLVSFKECYSINGEFGSENIVKLVLRNCPSIFIDLQIPEMINLEYLDLTNNDGPGHCSALFMGIEPYLTKCHTLIMSGNKIEF